MILLNLILTFTQIALETLPISSTAHILIVKKFFNNFIDDQGLFSEYFFKLCNIPTLFVLIFYFKNELWTIVSKKQKTLNIFDQKDQIFKFFKLILFGIISCSVTAIFYFILKTEFLSRQFIQITPFSLALAMLFSSLVLLSTRFIASKNQSNDTAILFPNINLGSSILIGLAQSMSLVPGISRFVSTYTACRWLGNNGAQSFRFSFLLHSILSIGLIIKIIAFDQIKMKMIIDKKLILIFTLISVIAMIISWFFLKLSDKLSSKNNLWKFAFYYPIPIALIILLTKFTI